MTSLLTLGTFDLFHSGHVTFLRQCSRLADHITVAVNTDDFVERFKGRKPTITLQERMAVLRACRHVDEVLINSGVDQRKLIEAWMRGVNENKVIAIGADWTPQDYLAQLGVDEEFLRTYHLTLVYVHNLNDLHSTEIRERCQP